MSDPTPTVPLGLSTQQIAEAFVTEARRGDAVIPGHHRVHRSRDRSDAGLGAPSCRACP